MIIYQTGNLKLFSENIFQKRVLILGSGPSAREIDWVAEDWEELITTSFFYLNDKVVGQNPIHVSLSRIIDLKNPKLLEYLDSNPRCTISFEPKVERHVPASWLNEAQDISDVFPYVRMVHGFYNSNEFRDFFEKYKERFIFFRAESAVGLVGRACWLTLDKKPKILYLCGIDGVSKDRRKDPKNYFRDHKGTADDYSYEKYLNFYKDFAKKLYQAEEEMKIPIKNLGKGKPYNMLS